MASLPPSFPVCSHFPKLHHRSAQGCSEEQCCKVHLDGVHRDVCQGRKGSLQSCAFTPVIGMPMHERCLSAGTLEELKLKEIKNGRLAMLAFVGAPSCMLSLPDWDVKFVLHAECWLHMPASCYIS